LISQKWSDYQLFKQVVELIKLKQHLTKEGLKKIVSIKAVLNNGLSVQLKQAFPGIDPATRPQNKNQKIQDPNWVSGFIDAECCFYVSLEDSSYKTNAGGSVRLRLFATQHIRDIELLKNLAAQARFLGCGRYYERSGEKPVGDYIVTNFKDIYEKIICSAPII